MPLIRPNEAIDLLVGATLAARGLVRARTGQLPRIRLDRIELAVILMAVSNSVIPLLWMMVRQEAITQDDLLYALVMWKLLGIYAIVRARREHRQAGAAVPVAVCGRRVCRGTDRDHAVALPVRGAEAARRVLRGPDRVRAGGWPGQLNAGAARRDRGPHDFQPGDREPACGRATGGTG